MEAIVMFGVMIILAAMFLIADAIDREMRDREIRRIRRMYRRRLERIQREFDLYRMYK